MGTDPKKWGQTPFSVFTKRKMGSVPIFSFPFFSVVAGIAGAPQGMPTPHGRAFLARDVLVDDGLQLVGAAAQAMQLALDELGVLVGDAEDLLCEPLGGGLRQAQELDEIVCRAEGATARLRIHRASIAGGD